MTGQEAPGRTGEAGGLCLEGEMTEVITIYAGERAGVQALGTVLPLRVGVSLGTSASFSELRLVRLCT